jgi:hypothetical protein
VTVAAPRERPILFSGAMVRAILEGRKTQTRRIMRPQPEWPQNRGWRSQRDLEAESHRFPYGKPGDRLWVRETWQAFKTWNGKPGVAYRASCPNDTFDCTEDGCVDQIRILKWRPAIFMPRDLSRLAVEVTDVRVERLQDITADDARAEGMPPEGPQPAKINGELGSVYYFDPVVAFAHGWNTINGKRAPWTSNPWVWVVTFRRLEG